MSGHASSMSKRVGFLVARRGPHATLFGSLPVGGLSARATVEVLSLHSGTLFSGFVTVADAPDRE